MALRTFHIRTKTEVIDDASGHWIVAVNFRKSSQLDEALWALWEQVHEPYSLEIYAHRQHTQLCVTAEDAVIDKIQGALYVMNTSAQFIDISDPTELVTPNDIVMTEEYRLKRSDLLPIHTFEDCKHDPLAPLLNVLSGLPYNQKIYIQYVAQRVDDNWYHEARVKLKKAAWIAEFPFHPIHWFRPFIMERFEKANQKADRMPFNVNLRIAIAAPPPLEPDDEEELERIVTSMERSRTCIFHGISYTAFSHMGRLKETTKGYGLKEFQKVRERRLVKPFWFSRQELATQWHPVQVNMILNLSEVISAKANPPAQLSSKIDPTQVSYFARTEYRNSNIHFGIRRPDRRSHVHVVGKSGVGKSKLIQLLAKSDIDNGYGLALIDCHGDLVDELLRLIPEQRIDDVALLDISDYDYPICFNPFFSVREKNRRYMAQEFLYTLKRIGDLSLSETAEELVIQALITIMVAPNTSTLSVLRMFTDKGYLSELTQSLTDEALREYWVEKVPELDKLIETEEIQGVVRLLSHLLSSDLVSFVLGQHENRFDFTEMIASNKIILVKVPKKNLGRQSSVLLGSLVLSLLNVAAAERSMQVKSNDRRDFYIYIDEFQNFASTAVSRAIAAGESNQVSYTIAHQMIRQLPGDVYETLSARVQNLIAFQVGGEDAGALESRLSPPFERSDMANLDARSFYIRMLVEGALKEAFSARTEEVVYPAVDFAEEARAASRIQYAHARVDIEANINSEYTSPYSPGES